MFAKRNFFAGLIVALLCLTTNTTFAQKGSLNDFKHIEGRWIGQFNGGPIEGSWSAPMANNITGFLRIMRDNQPVMYEIFSFEETDNGPVVRVKHFNKGLISIQDKEGADQYKFISAGKNTVEVEKLDGQVRIIYELRKKNQFVLRKGTLKDGKWDFIDLFVFDRIK